MTDTLIYTPDLHFFLIEGMPSYHLDASHFRWAWGRRMWGLKCKIIQFVTLWVSWLTYIDPGSVENIL